MDSEEQRKKNYRHLPKMHAEKSNRKKMKRKMNLTEEEIHCNEMCVIQSILKSIHKDGKGRIC